MSTLLSCRFTLPLLAVLSLLAVFAIPVRAQSPAGSVALVAVDTDIAGNSATAVGDAQVCSELGVGEELEVDVVVRGIPPVDAESDPRFGVGGTTGFQFMLGYDERYIHITGLDISGQLLGTDPQSNVIDAFSDVVPDEDGGMLIAAADFGTGAEESGDGVFARLTVRGISAGTSDLRFIDDAVIVDLGENRYEIDALNGGLIAVGVTCDPNATPPPSPPPTSGPPTGEPPEDSPGETGNGGEESTGTTDGPTGTGGPDNSPSRTSGATGSPGNGATGDDDDDDGGGSSSLILIIAAIAVLVVLGGGGAYFFMRRRETPAP